MTERANRAGEADEVKVDDPEDVERDDVQLSWQRIFMLLTAVSQEEGVTINERVRSGLLEINGDDSYSIRVNPAIPDPSGNLEIVSVSLYHDGIHVQQVTAKARWENGTPEVVFLDNDPIEGPLYSLGVVKVAKCSEHLLGRVNVDTDHTDIPRGAIFPVPNMPNRPN